MPCCKSKKTKQRLSSGNQSVKRELQKINNLFQFKGSQTLLGKLVIFLCLNISQPVFILAIAVAMVFTIPYVFKIYIYTLNEDEDKNISPLILHLLFVIGLLVLYPLFWVIIVTLTPLILIYLFYSIIFNNKTNENTEDTNQNK